MKYGNQKLRDDFEAWYVVNAFDLEANPIGSRQCDLQWRAWAASRGCNSAGHLGTELGPHPRPRGPGTQSPMNPDAPWNKPVASPSAAIATSGERDFEKWWRESGMDRVVAVNVEAAKDIARQAFDAASPASEGMGEMREMLERFGRHADDCAVEIDPRPMPCDCGWSEARALLDKVKK